MAKTVRDMVGQAMFKRVFQKRDEHQRRNFLFAHVALDGKCYVHVPLQPQSFEVQMVADVLNLFAQQDAFFVALIEHIAHDLAQFQHYVRGFCVLL